MFLLGRSLVLEGHLDDPVMIWVEGTVVIDLLVECKSWMGEGEQCYELRYGWIGNSS